MQDIFGENAELRKMMGERASQVKVHLDRARSLFSETNEDEIIEEELEQWAFIFSLYVGEETGLSFAEAGTLVRGLNRGTEGKLYMQEEIEELTKKEILPRWPRSRWEGVGDDFPTATANEVERVASKDSDLDGTFS